MNIVMKHTGNFTSFAESFDFALELDQIFAFFIKKIRISLKSLIFQPFTQNENSASGSDNS